MPDNRPAINIKFSSKTVKEDIQRKVEALKLKRKYGNVTAIRQRALQLGLEQMLNGNNTNSVTNEELESSIKEENYINREIMKTFIYMYAANNFKFKDDAGKVVKSKSGINHPGFKVFASRDPIIKGWRIDFENIEKEVKDE